MKFSNPVGQISPGYSESLQAYSSITPLVTLVIANVRVNLLPQLPSTGQTGYLLFSASMTVKDATILYLEASPDGVNFTPIWAGVFSAFSTASSLVAPVMGIQLPIGYGVWAKSTQNTTIGVTIVYAYGNPPF